MKRILTIQYQSTVSIVIDSDHEPGLHEMNTAITRKTLFDGARTYDLMSFTVKPVSELEFDMIKESIRNG